MTESDRSLSLTKHNLFTLPQSHASPHRRELRYEGALSLSSIELPLCVDYGDKFNIGVVHEITEAIQINADCMQASSVRSFIA